MQNLLFYKYVEIEDKEKLKLELLDFCNNIEVKGKILLADEGINANITGDEKQISQFLKYLRNDNRFLDIEIKLGHTTRHNFKRMLVKLRKEIISTRFEADIKNKADYIEPQELLKKYENSEDFIIIDTRNDYEYDVGHFENAVKLPINTFQDFPKGVKSIQNLKDKEVITFCTGGVRCEKASAYLKQNGFKNVKQLHGGIIKYGEVIGDKHWNGKCFVFDERGAIEIDPKKQEENYIQCSICYVPNEESHTCPFCSKEYIMCSRCMPLMDDCCSKFCRNKIRNRNSNKIETEDAIIKA
jgi:UPF0176 protein